MEEPVLWIRGDARRVWTKKEAEVWRELCVT